MVGQQYSAEQRNFILIEYVKEKTKSKTGTKDFYNKVIIILNSICIFKLNLQVKASFQAKYPGSPVQEKPTIRRIFLKQNKHFTLHNLNSKASPGDTHSGRRKSARTPQNTDAVNRVVTEGNCFHDTFLLL